MKVQRINVQLKYFQMICNLEKVIDHSRVVVAPKGVTQDFFSKFLEFTLNSSNQSLQLFILEKMIGSGEARYLNVKLILELLEIFQVAPIESEAIIIEQLIQPMFTQLQQEEQSTDFKWMKGDRKYYCLIELLVHVHRIMVSKFRTVDSGDEEECKMDGSDSSMSSIALYLYNLDSYKSIEIRHWLKLFERLQECLIRRMPLIFTISNKDSQSKLIDKLVDLKHDISQHWLEMIIREYCKRNRMMLPQTNGANGLASMKIVDLLMKVRGVSSVFQLLDIEQTELQRSFNDPSKHPLNTKSFLRIQKGKLDSAFYKELETFSKEGFKWKPYIWRVNGDIKSSNYANNKYYL